MQADVIQLICQFNKKPLCCAGLHSGVVLLGTEAGWLVRDNLGPMSHIKSWWLGKFCLIYVPGPEEFFITAFQSDDLR